MTKSRPSQPAQLARIQEYLIALRATDDVDTARRLLKRIVILGTYIKRRSKSLFFVCDKAEDIDTTELRLSLFESAESLRLSDIRCAVQITDTAKRSPLRPPWRSMTPLKPS